MEMKEIADEKYYKTEINTIKQELKKLPSGYLVRRGTYYYSRSGTTEKGITKDPKKINQLARKAYLLRRLKNLEWNYCIVQKISKRYKTEEPIEIIRELSPCYSKLPDNCFFHSSADEQSPINGKSKISYETNKGHQDGLIYLTNSGLRVRSKSERTIADLLDRHEILYRYEAALALGGENRYPDFTIYSPFDGNIFLWEHFGMMNDAAYRQKVNDKLALYARYGFYPFSNLICTYEQDLTDSSRIQRIIEMFFKDGEKLK